MRQGPSRIARGGHARRGSQGLAIGTVGRAVSAAVSGDVIATACRSHGASRRLRGFHRLPPALTTFGPTRSVQGRK
ncbi:hypothetical protein AB0D91_28320 [Streptomyces canus]|uniref:hypothetical protein n=1 Tax=Streptomyces canus TaxID=58343 RepID=UPI0034075032